ncbi:unnamed protein product, partial [Ectocarpus sp. 12 AP-2014]
MSRRRVRVCISSYGWHTCLALRNTSASACKMRAHAHSPSHAIRTHVQVAPNIYETAVLEMSETPQLYFHSSNHLPCELALANSSTANQETRCRKYTGSLGLVGLRLPSSLYPAYSM